MSRKARTHITLAVFAFENLSTNNLNELFCKSLSIDLITELQRFKQFQIISHKALERLSSTSDMFRQLGTDYYVQGTFLSAQDEVQINIELVNSDSLHVVWAERLEGKSDNLQKIQHSLLLALVSSLQRELNLDLISQLPTKPEVDRKAYEWWLYGNEEIKKGSIDHDKKAREYFRKAIELDPNYSMAYSGMSLSYFNEWSCQLWDRWELSQNGASEWAQKAIELDERNYVAAFILGRILLYEGAHETSEYYLRKSLQLNANDPDSLIQIASCFTYLGYPQEAFELYEKAIELNPVQDSYHHVGALILFELGRDGEAANLVDRIHKHIWVDAPAIFSAIYHRLGNHEKAAEYWRTFKSNFVKMINEGKDASDEDAVKWQMTVSPYKNKTRMLEFWSAMAKQEIQLELPHPVQDESGEFTFQFERKGDLWQLIYEGQGGFLPEVKGFYDIARLIEQPHTPIHCGELMGGILIEEGDVVLDDAARESYRSRIVELEQEITRAQDEGDLGETEKLHTEYDQLVDYLTKNLGLRGKSRKTGGSIDKARSAVTWRIRKGISRIEKANPHLGRHLNASIKTGTMCTYAPEKDILWHVSV